MRQAFPLLTADRRCRDSGKTKVKVRLVPLPVWNLVLGQDTTRFHKRGFIWNAYQYYVGDPIDTVVRSK